MADPLTTPYDQNSVTPVIAGDLVIYSGLSNPDDGGPDREVRDDATPQEVWKNADVSMYMSTAVVAGDTLVGLGQRNRGHFFALDLKTGKTLWTTRGRETENAALIRVPGYTLIQTAEGELIVLRDSATAFDSSSATTSPTAATWAHPALVGNQLFVRDANSLTLWTIGGCERRRRTYHRETARRRTERSDYSGVRPGIRLASPIRTARTS